MVGDVAKKPLAPCGLLRISEPIWQFGVMYVIAYLWFDQGIHHVWRHIKATQPDVLVKWSMKDPPSPYDMQQQRGMWSDFSATVALVHSFLVLAGLALSGFSRLAIPGRFETAFLGGMLALLYFVVSTAASWVFLTPMDIGPLEAQRTWMRQFFGAPEAQVAATACGQFSGVSMVLWVTGGLFVREAAKLQRWHGFYPESVMKQVWPLLTVELGLFLLGRWDGSGGEGGPSAGIHCLALGAGLAIGAMVRNSAEEAQKAISFLPATLSAAVLVCAALTLGSGILYASGEGQFAAASSTMLVTTGRFIGDVGRAGLVHAAVDAPSYGGCVGAGVLLQLLRGGCLSGAKAGRAAAEKDLSTEQHLNRVAAGQGSKPILNIRRRSSDYFVIVVIYALYAMLGEYIHPGRTPPEEAESIWWVMSLLGRAAGFPLGSPGNVAATLVGFYLLTSAMLFAATFGLHLYMRRVTPEMPTTHLTAQAKTIAANFFLLPVYQVLWEYLQAQGWTKVTTGNLEPALFVRDVALWLLAFELSWYTQHRAMHDNKFLWELGHSYHHSWKKPEHMIGITNFAFDHIVETWVTMSSAFIPVLLFPINHFVAKILGLIYMLYAVLVHWDAFSWFSQYHLNHHYLVVKNYGSHIPIYDILFGTYQWEEYVPTGRWVQEGKEHAE